jgi:hypothetical protein
MVVAKVFLYYYTLHAACYCTDIDSCRMYIVQQNSSVPAPVCTNPTFCTCIGYILIPVCTSCCTSTSYSCLYLLPLVLGPSTQACMYSLLYLHRLHTHSITRSCTYFLLSEHQLLMPMYYCTHARTCCSFTSCTCLCTASCSKLGTRSDEAMKRCDEALNASLLQFLCQR